MNIMKQTRLRINTQPGLLSGNPSEGGWVVIRQL